MPSISNPPPYEETIAFLRNSPPPGEYSRVETEKRIAARAAQQAAIPEVKLAKVRASQFWDGPTKTKNKRKYRGPSAAFFGNFVGKPCAYCNQPMIGRRFPTRDHVIPLCLGGSNRPGNLKVVCDPCNGHKGARTLEQFAIFLTDHGDPRAAIVWALLERAPPLR